MKFGVFLNQYYMDDAFDEQDLFEQVDLMEDLRFDYGDAGRAPRPFPGQSQESTLRCLERFGTDVLPTFT